MEFVNVKIKRVVVKSILRQRELWRHDVGLKVRWWQDCVCNISDYREEAGFGRSLNFCPYILIQLTLNNEGVGMPTPHANENPSITFDSPKT